MAADGSHPALAALVDGLPVAGFSGTLALRFVAGLPRTAAGVVRGKTGTLTGVSSLAGTTTVAGRPVVFVVMTDRVPAGATLQARDDLDRFAAVLSAGAGPPKVPRRREVDRHSRGQHRPRKGGTPRWLCCSGSLPCSSASGES